MREIALLLLTTLGAAVIAYLGNQRLFRATGKQAAFLTVPWWEEACKAVAIGLLPGVPVLTVHLLFGLLEFIYDWWRTETDGFFLGLLTLSGHGLFGGLAALIYLQLGSLWWAYVMAGLAHMLYNLAVVHLVLPTLGAGAYAGPEKR